MNLQRPNFFRLLHSIVPQLRPLNSTMARPLGKVNPKTFRFATKSQPSGLKPFPGIVVGAHISRKTIAVDVIREYWHAKFKTYLKAHRKYYVHDEYERADVGDRVLIRKTRPYSKIKHWRLDEIIEKYPPAGYQRDVAWAEKRKARKEAQRRQQEKEGQETVAASANDSLEKNSKM